MPTFFSARALAQILILGEPRFAATPTHFLERGVDLLLPHSTLPLGPGEAGHRAPAALEIDEEVKPFGLREWPRSGGDRAVSLPRSHVFGRESQTCPRASGVLTKEDPQCRRTPIESGSLRETYRAGR